MIYYGCPKCETPMSSPDSMAGRSESCPECGNVTRVPVDGKTKSRRVYLLVALLAIGAIAGGGGIYFWTRPNPRFEDEQIAAWARAASDIEEMKQHLAVVAPAKHRTTVMALKMNDQPSDPLAVWQELEELLQKEEPSPADFQRMRRLAGQLHVLDGMYEDGIGPDSGAVIEQMTREIVSWQNAAGHL